MAWRVVPLWPLLLSLVDVGDFLVGLWTVLESLNLAVEYLLELLPLASEFLPPDPLVSICSGTRSRL